MDEVTLEQELAFADRQVARAERRISDLHSLVFQLDHNGAEATKTIELLTTLEKTHEILICTRDDISKLLLLLRRNRRH